MKNELYTRLLAFYIDNHVYLTVTEEVNGYGVFLVVGNSDTKLVSWWTDRNCAIESAVRLQPKNNEVIRNALSGRTITDQRFSW